MLSVAGTTQSQITSKLETAETCPVVWCNGVQVDDSAPEALITPQMPCSGLRDQVFLEPKVMIGDLGQGRCFHFHHYKIFFLYWHTISANWKGKHDKPILTPLPSRAPELIDKIPWDASIDIWALACVVSWTCIKLSSPVLISHEDIHSCDKAYVIPRDGLALNRRGNWRRSLCLYQWNP